MKKLPIFPELTGAARHNAIRRWRRNQLPPEARAAYWKKNNELIKKWKQTPLERFS